VLWNFATRGDLNDRGAVMRRVHSRWLSRAIDTPLALPRIPTIAVDRGGFEPITDTAGGRAWADAWWGRTLDRDDLGD
jgi:hypothetical protein